MSFLQRMVNLTTINYWLHKMYEDDSLEETTLKGIISSCENMLDDLEEGASISNKDMQDIIYADNVLIEIQQRIASNFAPTNVKYE